jgi:nuclear migration protein JNM1
MTSLPNRMHNRQLTNASQDGTARSASASSHYTDFSQTSVSPPSSPQISRSRLHPDAARTLFEPARINAGDVDFSDRVSGKKKGYKASSRRVKVLADGTREFVGGEGSDDEEDEGLERKIARLRREIEEVKAEAERRKFEAQESGKGEEDATAEDAASLSKMLDALDASAPNLPSVAATRFTHSLTTPLPPSSAPAAAAAPPKPSEGPATYTVTYAPSFAPSHALARTTAFDARLSALESALGIPALSLGSTAAPPHHPALTTLTQQLALLSAASPASLDALARRVRTLTAETEKLAAAKAGSEAADAAPRDDGEHEAKINALFGTLGTIERLAPLLPGVLERLRSLRAVHAEAATAEERVQQALERQEQMGLEIERWRVGLERVERAVAEGERVGGENVRAVEAWVRELEGRVKVLGG